MGLDDTDIDKARFFRHGPTRVIVNANGHAVSSVRAQQQYKVPVEIVFLRNDGWSLGAPLEFETIAYNMWKDQWVAYVRKPDQTFEPMSLYEAPKPKAKEDDDDEPSTEDLA